MNLKKLYLLGFSLLSFGVFAAIEYCPDTETIRVTDYSADYPCTPRILARVDKAFGWGKVTLDEQSGTIIVAANLTIGWNDGSKTFFQIADLECQNETLVVQGEVRIYPNWLVEENYHPSLGPLPHSSVFKRAGIINCLRLGLPDHPTVTGTLMLANHPRGKPRLIVGGFSGMSAQNMGGQLLAYHSSILPEPGSLIEEAYMGGMDRLELINSKVRGVKSVFGKALTGGTYKNTLFENCGVAATGTYLNEARGCSFINCGTGITVVRDCAVYDCKFSGNRLNWHLSYQGRLVAVDCEIDSWDKGAYPDSPTAIFISKRHLRVKVVDQEFKPLPKVKVEIIPLDNPEAVAGEFDNFYATTDSDGYTPSAGQIGSLIVTERVIRALNGKDQPPVHTSCSYRIKAVKDQSETEKQIDAPGASWKEYDLVLPVPAKTD